MKKGDLCESCRYNLACVLVLEKKAGFVEGSARDQLVKDATEHLEYVLDRMTYHPIEPEIGAIGRDDFLKAVVDQQRVKKALDSFLRSPKRSWRPSALE